MEPRYVIRAAIASSVAGHLALALGVFVADARPFDPTIPDNIAVDIVTPKETAAVTEAARDAGQDAAKPPDPPKLPDPFRLPDLTLKPTLEQQQLQMSAQKTQGAAASQPPPPQRAKSGTPTAPLEQASAAQQAQPQPAQQPAALPAPPLPASHQQALLQPAPVQASGAPPSPTPAPAQVEPDVTVKYGVMLGLPDGNGGAEAFAKADIAPLDIAAFRRHLKSCSTLPAEVSRSDKVRIVLRAILAPNGKLVTEPSLIEASASVKGPLLMQAAMRALEACQPYAMLPADKYNEWKVLDLPFTPQDFAG